MVTGDPPPGLVWNDVVGWHRPNYETQIEPFLSSSDRPAWSREPTRLIIAFVGRAGAGKTTAARHLVDSQGFVRIRFAGPLKSMLAALGLTPEEIDGDRKETPCELLAGRTPRHAMQTLGTEWGRDQIDSGLWIRAWRRAVEQTPPDAKIVVDDCRFPNEVEVIRRMSGFIVRVEREGEIAAAAAHSSEKADLPADRILTNAGSIDQLRTATETIARDFSWALAAIARKR